MAIRYHLGVTVEELHLLHEALEVLANDITVGLREAEVQTVLDLRSRIGGRIDDLIIAAGGDPT